ncbi:NADH-quinone oxidoreductase subunit L [Acidimangrovimonas sediminis]|uniref:NADH-quinone oxidoreductase subunit L n=1 Tax=Acidimangrovimonas sediminis TaxID=2056283 RepID=UPI000C7FE6A2|nr:NADH-quinone oxidoreductase subunit L [Acidimangrovimonas sediminis]
MVEFILFAPLVGAIVAGFGWRFITETGAEWLTTALLFAAAIAAWFVFFSFDGNTQVVTIFRWIDSGSLQANWGVRLDRLTTIMLIVVTTVSALVHLYSIGYMAHDENFDESKGENYRARFFAYISLFTFTMLALVTANNLLQLFFGWEGVGLVSYLLVGFYYKKPSANAAAIKAFIVNRVGDFGFLLGIFAIFVATDSINFDIIFPKSAELAQMHIGFLWTTWNAADVIGVLLFIGAAGKSAQLFLHTWLPDAMEGPTPVSALIHAATMVTAGVFLVCRMSPLYEYAPGAAALVLVIGATTAFFAATVGLVQTDIKRVIAYSTCSQLGYMFAAAGAGVYSAAMFHLMTHAFFKALLFLCAGSVITAMHHEQDMRSYGGLRKKIPFTFWMMVIGTLAITGTGIPFTGDLFGIPIGFAGYDSKDAIIEGVWGANGAGYAFWMLVIAAAFTSFYSWRLIFMTFFGAPKGDKHAHEHAHESPMVMLIPLGVLALGATFAGMIWYNSFFGNEKSMESFFHLPTHAEQVADGGAQNILSQEHQIPNALGAAEATKPGAGAIYLREDNQAIEHAHHAPAWVKISPFIAMALGFLLAWVMYIRSPSMPGKLAESQRPLYLFLLNKWYFDELYDAIFVRPMLAVGRFFWRWGDGVVIDGSINALATRIIPAMTRAAGRLQSGFVYTYAFTMVIGITLLVTWMTLTGGAQ